MRAFVLALASLLLAVPQPASADIYGRIGLFYARYDTWTPNAHLSAPRLQLDGSANASGPLVYREYGYWHGAVGYQQLRRTFSESDGTRSTLTYAADLSLLNGGAPVSVSLHALRSAIDASTLVGNVSTTGTELSTMYRADVNLRARSLPTVTIGGSLYDTTTNGFGVAPVSDSAKLLDVSTQHGTGPYDFHFQYGGRWNSSSVDLRNYTAHHFSFGGSAFIDPALSAGVSGRYYLRLPDTTTTDNPRYELNSVSTTLQSRGTHHRTVGLYAYEHQFFSSPLTGERERIANSVSATREIAHSTSWESRWTGDLTVSQAREDGLESSTTGASFSPVARWRRSDATRNLVLEAGPVIGVLKPAHASAELGSGAHWRGTVGWNRAVRTSLDYAGDYANNLRGARGWSIHQALTGGVDGALAGARAHGYVTVSATRQHNEVFGDAAGRDIAARGTLDWRRMSLQLDVAVRDGTTPAIGAARGDGLFIPSEYDSHGQSAGLSVQARLLRRLAATATARYARLSGPDVAAQQEANLYGSLQYSLGQIVLSLEDRYTAGGNDFDLRVNEVLVRVTRSFNAR